MAWDDVKGSGDLIRSSDWNSMVSDQKSRLLSVFDDPSPTLSSDLNANNHTILNLLTLTVGGNPVLTATPAERVIYIDNVNGDDTSGDGSEANPYKTVSRAKQDIPDSITYPITIHMKASPNTYDGFVLMNKVFTNTSGSLTVEGEMSVMDSGTISSYQYYASDPTYPDAHVLKVVDNSKSWTNNQFKDKLIQIFDSNGNQIHEALIESNTSDTLYIPHMYYGDITNFTYKILDWATTCEKVQLAYIPGSVTVRNLHLENNTYYQVYLKNVAYTVVKYCKIDKTGDKKTAVYVNATALSLNESVLYGHDLNYDGISAGYGTPIYVFIVGTFFRDFRYAVNLSGTQALIFFRDGCRITTSSNSSIARGGIFLNNPGANMSCYSPRGNPVIDCLGTAIILKNTTVQYENFIVYGPNVETKKDYQFSQEQTAGTIYFKAPVITGTAPSSSSSSGVKGQIAWDSNYLYVCVDTNTWKRVGLNNF